LFGDVPLALSTNADKNALLARSPCGDAYAQMIKDLQAAIQLLPDTAINTIPTRYAALALLSRVYLSKKEWSLAAATASAVIDAGKFALPLELNQVFIANSAETIFQWAPVLENFNSAEGVLFLPASNTVPPTYVVTQALVNAFELGDLRKTHWLKTIVTGREIHYFPYKYQVRFSTEPVEYNIVLRLAEQYLIRAEARARQDQIAAAVADINAIRKRAALKNIPTTINRNECMHAIQQERRTEFFAEWGHRWFDLKRTGKADSVLSIAKGANWQITDQLYPIPQSELDVAPNLKQNPGYN
jgi:starch-binding outer membrane protein, SusD/RagB family